MAGRVDPLLRESGTETVPESAADNRLVAHACRSGARGGPCVCHCEPIGASGKLDATLAVCGVDAGQCRPDMPVKQ